VTISYRSISWKVVETSEWERLLNADSDGQHIYSWTGLEIYMYTIGAYERYHIQKYWVHYCGDKTSG
jgi:hypothetical protein